MESEEPNRASDLTLKELPSRKLSKMEIWLPRRATPYIEHVDPSLA
jgi:hypothetical protein